MSYCSVNICCFLLEISGTPNFRPNFKYYTWYTALLGAIINLLILFYVDYKFAISALFCALCVFMYLIYRAPRNLWGDVTQSLIFHQVRKYLLRLDERLEHSKLWRPSILLFADKYDVALIDFCNNLKKGGLYIIGTTLKGDFTNVIKVLKQIKKNWLTFIDKNNIKAFPQISVCNDDNLRKGYENLLLLSGLGAMEPNTIVLPIIKLKKKKQRKNSGGEIVNKSKMENNNLNESKEDILNGNDGYVSDNCGDTDKLNGLKSLAKDIHELVTHSPSRMDVFEYTKLLKHIIDFEKNLVLTANFHLYPENLIVSENIQNTFKTILSTSKLTKVDTKIMSVNNQTILTINENQPEIKAVSSKTSSDHIDLEEHAHELKDQLNESEFVDLWLFTKNYSFTIENNQYDQNFPMLICQLTHILLQNKTWVKRAKLRIFLVQNYYDTDKLRTKWTDDDKVKFSEILQKIRLKTSQIIFIDLKADKPTNYYDNDYPNKIKKYYKKLNNQIKKYSTKTYFLLMNLPDFPRYKTDKLFEEIERTDEYKKNIQLYWRCMCIYLKGLPPVALVKTGYVLYMIL